MYMPTINLNNLGQSSNNSLPTYTDVKLDLEPKTISTDSLYRKNTTIDISQSVDEAAIKNSLINLFTTMPGQKLLEPTYGLNVNQYLFDAASEAIAEEIGEAILNGVSFWEPRVVIQRVSVNVDEDNNQYDIHIDMVIPTLTNKSVVFSGILNQTGLIVQ